ncbi:methyltransferase [Streptosporangium longisporum]|uniref:O-methyltransferase C-terminal domain-containing protein n=1 Tax=Streptosporangium longisporum TaxID=46187 RepID=A0ABN3Y7H1_9ACTN
MTIAPGGHPREVIQSVIGRYWLACGLLAFVDLDVARALSGERMGVERLAAWCGADPDSLTWLLRAMAPAGLVAVEAGEWYLLPAGEALVHDHPDSPRSAVRRHGDPAHGRMLRTLPGGAASRAPAVPAPPSPPSSTSPLSPSSAAGGETADAHRHVLSMLNALGDFGALLAAARQGWAEHLSDGPLSPPDLAGRLDAPVGDIEGIARTLAGLGVVGLLPDGRYALTEAGRTLRDDRPDSMRTAVLMGGDPVWWEAMWNLSAAVRTGRPSLPPPYRSGYDYLADDPGAQHLFDRFMTHRSAPIAERLGAWATPENVPDGSVVVDVGGGRGTLLAAVLTRRATCRGVLLERDVVVPQARAYLAGHGVADRCELIAGDFFTDLPAGHEVYLLGSVLHNWGDADALRLLRGVRAAMSDAGGRARLVCVDALPPDPPWAAATGNALLHGFNLRMMSLFPRGHERTATEYAVLLREAGFAVSSTAALPHGLTLVTAVPVTVPV